MDFHRNGRFYRTQINVRLGGKMFHDFGFKLIVINSLLDKETSFASSLREMEKRYTDNYEYGTYQCIGTR